MRSNPQPARTGRQRAAARATKCPEQIPWCLAQEHVHGSCWACLSPYRARLPAIRDKARQGGSSSCALRHYIHVTNASNGTCRLVSCFDFAIRSTARSNCGRRDQPPNSMPLVASDPLFPKFVSRRSTLRHEPSEAKGHWQLYDSMLARRSRRLEARARPFRSFRLSWSAASRRRGQGRRAQSILLGRRSRGAGGITTAARSIDDDCLTGASLTSGDASPRAARPVLKPKYEPH